MKRDYFFSLLTRALLLILGFAQGIVIARYLLPEGKGLIAVYIVSFNLVLSICNLGVRQSTSFLLAKQEKSIIELAQTHAVLLPLVWIMSVIALILTYATQGLIENIYIVAALLATTLFKLYVTFANGFALGKRDIAHFNISLLLPMVTEFIFVLLFVVYYKIGVEGYFYSILLSSIINSIFVYDWAKKIDGYTLKPVISVFRKNGFEIMRKGIAYAIPLFLFGLNYNLDILILNYFETVSEVGLYSQGVSLANLLWQIPTAINFVIFSHSVTAENPNAYSRLLWQKTKKLMLAILPLAIGFTGLVQFLVPWIYGVEFQRSATIVILLMPGIYFMVAFKVLNGDLAGQGKPLASLKIFSVAIIANVILNFLFIPKFGINGAAIASSISYVYASIHFVELYHNICVK
jgi:O-antigen/teichoic acid export membrane protein